MFWFRGFLINASHPRERVKKSFLWGPVGSGSSVQMSGHGVLLRKKRLRSPYDPYVLGS